MTSGNHDALSAVAEGGACCVDRPSPGARQAEPSLVESGCCWRREDTSGVDIGAHDARRARLRSTGADRET
jgi:hypothetical protein